MQATIQVQGLTKRYGRTTAVDNVTFGVRPGAVTGFIGPNGAGKSTTMRIILGLDAADGTVLINGTGYRALDDPLRAIGALLDANAVHPGRTARNHLRWLAYTNSIPAARVDEVLAQVGLSSVANKRVGGFSLGMRQRLGIAGALLGDPPIVMFDEPGNGLDPEGIIWIRTFMRELAAAGRTVFVSSHLMSELEDTADHLLIMGRGRLVADISMADLLTGASGDRIDVRTTQPTEAMAALANAGGEASTMTAGVVIVRGLTGDRVAAALGAAQVAFTEMRTHRASLEEAYLDLTKNVTEFSASPEVPA
ncbi:ABC transporter ATP-binding protein [Micromonospora sp. 067-2]|uniref:ABC transporter ATP-binding protein n=1 Tax=Micromonospora sp. 067-2 TaxID=2789270 RepID=UPI00397E03D0